MSDVEKQESQKTVVSFAAGLLVGGLLVWIFSDTNHEAPIELEINEESAAEVVTLEETADTEVETEEPVLTVGAGAIAVADQAAGSVIAIDGATFPTDDGWIAVRTYVEGQLGSILGAARYSKSQGLVPSEVELLVPTVAGNTYAVVFFTEDGDRVFNLATDTQIDAGITTFVAN